jgi:hypothetical protein
VGYVAIPVALVSGRFCGAKYSSCNSTFFLAGCTREDPNRNEKILLLVLCWLFVRHGELAQILAIVVLLVRRSCSRQEKLVFVDASEICTLGNEKNA